MKKAKGSSCILRDEAEGRDSEVETAGYPTGGGRQIAECLALGRGAFPA